jgi:integrase
MATFRKMESGKWRAEVARGGKRTSKVLPTKAAAKEWASRQEYLIVNEDAIMAGSTFGELLDRYSREVSPKKRGARWEQVRLAKIARSSIAQKRASDLRAADFAAWRDARLQEVAPGSVIREMNMMGSVFNVAVKEWGVVRANPLADVRRPPKPPARDRRPTPNEIEKLRHSAGEDLSHATARAFHAFLFAIETAMRAGEIVGLTPNRVDLDRRVVRLIHTKNGRPRDVPLSSEAIRLLRALPPADPVFGLTSRQLDVLWRKLRDRAGVEGLTFHDSRHEAITRLSKKLDVLALARMVGHTDLRQLQVYYNETAEELAKRLD